jgi:ADP-ribose pyrophosphatase YjhB (NUDIX family)
MNYGVFGLTTPGDRVEQNESPLEALRREVLEEAGLEVLPGELIGVYAKPRRNDLILSFRAKVVGCRNWEPNGEIAEIGYFSKAELPSPMSVTASIRIADAFEGKSGIFRVIDEGGANAI